MFFPGKRFFASFLSVSLASTPAFAQGISDSQRTSHTVESRRITNSPAKAGFSSHSLLLSPVGSLYDAGGIDGGRSARIQEFTTNPGLVLEQAVPARITAENSAAIGIQRLSSQEMEIPALESDAQAQNGAQVHQAGVSHHIDRVAKAQTTEHRQEIASTQHQAEVQIAAAEQAWRAKPLDAASTVVTGQISPFVSQTVLSKNSMQFEHSIAAVEQSSRAENPAIKGGISRRIDQWGKSDWVQIAASVIPLLFGHSRIGSITMIVLAITIPTINWTWRNRTSIASWANRLWQRITGIKISARVQHVGFVIFFGTFYLLQRHAVTHHPRILFWKYAATHNTTTLEFLVGLFIWSSVISLGILLTSFRLRSGIRSEGSQVLRAFRKNLNWLWNTLLWGILLHCVNVFLFTIPFAKGWGSPAEFTAIDALSTLFIGVWLRILYHAKVKSNIWLSGGLIAAYGLIFALVRPHIDIPVGVTPLQRMFGFLLFTTVAALLALEILGKGKIRNAVQALTAENNESVNALWAHYPQVISQIEYGSSLLGTLSIGSLASIFLLHEHGSPFSAVLDPPTMAAGLVYAVSWWGMGRAIFKGLKPSQFMPSFNSMPAWVMFWSFFFARNSLPKPTFIPLALLASVGIVIAAYIGNQDDLPTATKSFKKFYESMPPVWRWIAAIIALAFSSEAIILAVVAWFKTI